MGVGQIVLLILYFSYANQEPSFQDILSWTISSLAKTLGMLKQTVGLNKQLKKLLYDMMSSNGNIFCVTGHLCGEFTFLQKA